VDVRHVGGKLSPAVRGVAVDAYKQFAVRVVFGCPKQLATECKAVKSDNFVLFVRQSVKMLYCLFSFLFDKNSLPRLVGLVPKQTKGLALEDAFEKEITTHHQKDEQKSND
jgi:hypothetical protein